MTAFQYWVAMPWWLAAIVAIVFMVAVMFALLWVERWYMATEKRLAIRNRKRRQKLLRELRVCDKGPACWRDVKGIHR